MLAFTLGLAPASRAELPSLVDAPLDVRVALPKKARQQLVEALRAAVLGEVGLSTPSEAERASLGVAEGCAAEDDCLVGLARRASAQYALGVLLERSADGKTLTASGRVLRKDGTLARARQEAHAKLAKGRPLLESAREVLKGLLRTLDLPRLPGPQPVAAPVAAPVEAPRVESTSPATVVEVTAPARPGGGGAARAVGVVSLVVGGLAAAAGGGLLAWAELDGRTLGLSSGAFTQVPTDESLALLDSVRTRRLAGITSAAAGGAVAVLGIILLAAAPPDAPATAVVVPVPGGAVVSVAGPLPR